MRNDLMERKVYRVHTQYIFEGVFEVVAQTERKPNAKSLKIVGW